MANWNSKINVKHLFTESEEHADVQASMSAVADVLKENPFFVSFTWLDKFYKIPDDNDLLTPVEYANLLLSKMYDFADSNRVWID